MVELDINQIVNLIPQRYPFIMIDRIVELDPWKRAVGIKNISMNEAYFQGHFPESPIMPGVLMIEAIAQVGIVLYKYKNEVTPLAKYELVLGTVKSRFLGSAYPGDQLLIEVIPVRFISTGGMAKGICTVKGRKVCSVEISFIAKDITQR
jgi:3-hydroxyacyl-[acyl-carrier-protein] dehydratase